MSRASSPSPSSDGQAGTTATTARATAVPVHGARASHPVEHRRHAQTSDGGQGARVVKMGQPDHPVGHQVDQDATGSHHNQRSEVWVAHDAQCHLDSVGGRRGHKDTGSEPPGTARGR